MGSYNNVGRLKLRWEDTIRNYREPTEQVWYCGLDHYGSGWTAVAVSVNHEIKLRGRGYVDKHKDSVVWVTFLEAVKK